MTRPPHTMAAAGFASRTGRRRCRCRGVRGRPRAWFFTALALVLLSSGCRARGTEAPMTGSPGRPLLEVLAAHTPDLMKVPGVVGTAESLLDDGRPCILVMVARLTPELKKRIPAEIDGWPVRVQETGEIRAMPGTGR